MDGTADAVRHAGECEGGRYAVFKFDQRALMVTDVIVAPEDAAAVPAVPQGFQNALFGLILREDIRRPGADCRQVGFAGIKTASLCHRAVKAAQRTSCRSIFRSEISQAAERGNLQGLLPRQPEENVQIMAALLHDNRACQVTVAPVAAHEAVRDMEVADVFRMVDAYYLPQHAAVEDLLQFDKKRRVAQHMAYRYAQPLFRGLSGDLQALQRVRRDGLFQEKVPASVQPGHGMGVMIPVHRGDNQRIRFRHRADQFQRVGKEHGFRRGEQPVCPLQLFRMPVCHGNYLITENIVGIAGIDHAARSRANQSQLHSMHLLPRKRNVCYVI